MIARSFPGFPTLTKSKRTNTHIPAFYFRNPESPTNAVVPSVLNSHYMTYSARELQKQPIRYHLLAPNGTRKSRPDAACASSLVITTQTVLAFIQTALRSNLRLEPQPKLLRCEFWSWSKYLSKNASRACRGTPRAAGAPPSCPCACGWRGRARSAWSQPSSDRRPASSPSG